MSDLTYENIDIAPPKMRMTDEEMAKAKIPKIHRNFCAHLWVPLQKCRVDEYFLPFRCKKERHAYEECLYALMVRRMKIKKFLDENIEDLLKNSDN
ncbi:NADH dehydrogenase 1 beta subcomplex subunit 7 ndufb7 [Coelomomyces lativittatus]|nr:NADH dehydrogenase 1 beta subcomplex subunit 7 ndufb7 [Coelomomyces lativittatus]KAJ1515111.1 NADH dehydrogenase 1 beta subcomplex subunit 7 ndufb7 [Coelomomyces lativittatus]